MVREENGDPPILGPVEKKRAAEICEVVLRILLDVFHPLEPGVETMFLRGAQQFCRGSRECAEFTQEKAAEKAVELERVTVIVFDLV